MKTKLLTMLVCISCTSIYSQTANSPAFSEHFLASRADVGHVAVAVMENDHSVFDSAIVYTSGKDSASLYWRNNFGQGSVVLDGYGNITPHIDFTHVALTADGVFAVVTYDNSDNTASFHHVYYEVYRWDPGINAYALHIPSTFVDYGFNPYVSVEGDYFVIGYRGISGFHINNYIKVVTGDIFGSLSSPVELSNNPTINALLHQHSYGCNVYLKDGIVYTAFVCADRNSSFQWINSYLFINEDDFFDLQAGAVTSSILVDTEPYSEFFTFPMIDGSESLDHIGITVQKGNGGGNFDIRFYWSHRSSLSFTPITVTDPSLSSCSNTRPMIAYSGDYICISWVNNSCTHVGNLDRRDILYQIYGGPFPPANLSNSTIERANNHFTGDQFRVFIAGEYNNNTIQMVYFDQNTGSGQIKYKKNYLAANHFRPMGNEYFDNQSSIKLYPNPSSRNSQVTVTHNKDNIKFVEICDLTGKSLKVISNQSSPSQILFDVSGLSKGNYMVKIVLDDGKHYHQILQVAD